MAKNNKKRFIDTYVASFLASRAAIHYEEWCAEGRHDFLTDNQPIEDARFQAEETWKLYRDTTVSPNQDGD